MVEVRARGVWAAGVAPGVVDDVIGVAGVSVVWGVSGGWAAGGGVEAERSCWASLGGCWAGMEPELDWW